MESKATEPTTSRECFCPAGIKLPPSILLSAALNQGQGDSFLHDLSFLIDDLPLPGDSSSFAPRTRFFLQHLGVKPDRVANENRAFELPAANFHKCQRPHGRAVDAQAAGHRENKQAMGNGSLEKRFLGEFVI